MFTWIIWMILFNSVFVISRCNSQVGPDPWDVGSRQIIEDDIPPDLKAISTKVKLKADVDQVSCQWFYKRLIAITLRGGQRKEEDDTIDVSFQMRYSQAQWNILNEYIKSNTVLTEEMLRRSIGYIEDSIYKPTITEKIVLAWSEYVYIYLVEYKEYITWGMSILATIAGSLWLWHYISYKNLIILIVILMYLYEAFLSYKEAEKEEVARFVSAIKKCKWFFWTCENYEPDPILIFKHMNPLKIGVRMLTTLVSEPMIMISDVVNTMILNITGGMWYPLDYITYGVLVTLFNGLLIFLLVGIIFNYLLNIPFNISLLGIFSINLQQWYGSKPDSTTRNVPEDKITGETLNKVLDVCSKALSIKHSSHIADKALPCNLPSSLSNSSGTIKRSSSTGRLPGLMSSSGSDNLRLFRFSKPDGSGDAR
ncbi:unnamed protein product [Leptidea sinapis]|uniref:Chloride channel CLIC-like protein 1 n=1 Tax=Leptidea sinapis TaxID=189913 RepID=A0A5E4PTW9_9NEOP|nr:unnamed protein product [Leptidea sinapis]